MSRVARAHGVILRRRPCFLDTAQRLVAVLPSTAQIEKMRAGYPNRSLLRRGLDTCSTSQSIHTKAMPRPTTTPKNNNVKLGAVSMVVIRNALQVAYQ